MRADLAERHLELRRELQEARNPIHAGVRDATVELAVVADDVFGLTAHLVEHAFSYHRRSVAAKDGDAPTVAFARPGSASAARIFASNAAAVRRSSCWRSTRPRPRAPSA